MGWVDKRFKNRLAIFTHKTSVTAPTRSGIDLVVTVALAVAAAVAVVVVLAVVVVGDEC